MSPRRPRPDQPARSARRTLLTGIGLALMAPLLAIIILTAMAIIRYTARSTALPASGTPALTALAAGGAAAASASAGPDVSLTPTLGPAPATPNPSDTPAPAPSLTAALAPSDLPTATSTPPPAFEAASATAVASEPPPGFIVSLTPIPAAATSTATPSPTALPGETAAPTLTPAPLAFAGTRAFFDETVDSFRVVGEIVNHTTGPQQIVKITGYFYDAQGSRLAGPDQTLEFFPQAVIPAGDRAPFELLVDQVTTIARYELMVDYVPSLLPVRQDLTISDLAQLNRDGRYCLTGVLRNPGTRLTDALVIAAVLYDAAGQVVNFGEQVVEGPAAPVGAQILNFEVCVPPPNTGIAQTQVRAWGR